MELKLNGKVVRDMAKRLRRAVGIEAMAEGKSFEVLSQTLIGKNWDTLSGMVGKNDSPKEEYFAPAEPVRFYVEAFSTVETVTYTPGWALVTLDKALMLRIQQLRAMCIEQELSYISAPWFITKWDPNSNSSMGSVDLIVGKKHVWFASLPKHAEGAVETRQVSIDMLLSTLKTRESSEWLIWRKDILVLDIRNDVETFLEDLYHSEEISEDYLD